MRKGIVVGLVLASIIMSGCGQEEKREARLDPSPTILYENVLTETILYEDVSTTWEDF